MINIATEDLVLVLYIPHNGHILPDDAGMVLAARSTHDLGESLVFTMQGWEVSGDYVKACVERPEGLHEGEWEYTLAADGAVISNGLMQVGQMPGEAAVVQYNKEVEYKEYGNE